MQVLVSASHISPKIEPKKCMTKASQIPRKNWKHKQQGKTLSWQDMRSTMQGCRALTIGPPVFQHPLRCEPGFAPYHLAPLLRNAQALPCIGASEAWSYLLQPGSTVSSSLISSRFTACCHYSRRLTRCIAPVMPHCCAIQSTTSIAGNDRNIFSCHALHAIPC